MKNLFNTLFLLICLLPIGNAQITLTSTNAPVVRTAHKTRDVDSISAVRLNIGAAGTNQTWNFTGVQLDATIPLNITTYALPTGAPSANLFPTATLVSRSSYDNNQSVNYLRVNASEWVNLGDVDSTGQANVSAQPQVYFKYPFTLNSNFKDTADFEDPDLGVVTARGNVTGDATGTVQTTLGSFNALRVKREFDASASFQGFPLTINLTTYEWWTATHTAPVISRNRIIINFAFFGITDTTYSATILTGQTVGTQEVAEKNAIAKTYPSPANENVSIDFELPTTSSVTALIIGLNGQSMTTHKFGELAAGKQTQSLNVAHLVSGSYQIVLLSEKGKIGSQKIIVNH